MGRTKKPRKRVAKENRQNLRLWAEGARETVLTAHIPAYTDALQLGWREERDKLQEICNEFHARISWRLADHEEPELPLPVFDAHAVLPAETLTEEEMKVKADRRALLDARIRRWLKYRARRLLKHTRKKTDPLKDPWAILLGKLSGYVAPPKARQAYQQFMREAYTDRIAPVVTERWAAEAAPGSSVQTQKEPDAPFRAKVAREIFNEMSQSEKAGFGERAKAEASAAREAFEKGMKETPSKSPEARQKCIDSVGGFLAPILQGVLERTGMHVVVILGGPMPKYGGEIRTVYVSVGRNRTAAAAHFPQWARERFTSVLDLMKEYLGTAFTPQEIRDAALPEDMLAAAKYTIAPTGDNPGDAGSDSDSDSDSSSDSESDSGASESDAGVAKAAKKNRKKERRAKEKEKEKAKEKKRKEAEARKGKGKEKEVPAVKKGKTAEGAGAGAGAEDEDENENENEKEGEGRKGKAGKKRKAVEGEEVQGGPTRKSRRLNTGADAPPSIVGDGAPPPPPNGLASPPQTQDGAGGGLPARILPPPSPDGPPSPSQTQDDGVRGSEGGALPAAFVDEDERVVVFAGGEPMMVDEVRVPLDVPGNAAPWLKHAVATMTAQDLGPHFAAALCALVRLEVAYGFDTNPRIGISSATPRPKEVDEWIRSGRGTRSKKTVRVDDLVTFGKTWNAWWASIQPSWREKDAEGVFSTGGEYGDDWSTLDFEGQNGNLTAVAGLYFWGSTRRKLSVLPSGIQEDWERAVQDVTWMLEGLGAHVDAPRARSSRRRGGDM
ncbi:hypothetical protein DFH09DRAFT_1329919 [Mycena vulgaris]|nr:hypothetical protein DFH09DRAFT_1329919 [Mycena vulgaris]